MSTVAAINAESVCLTGWNGARYVRTAVLLSVANEVPHPQLGKLAKSEAAESG